VFFAWSTRLLVLSDVATVVRRVVADGPLSLCVCRRMKKDARGMARAAGKKGKGKGRKGRK
jgi:hypothetical protein